MPFLRLYQKNKRAKRGFFSILYLYAYAYEAKRRISNASVFRNGTVADNTLKEWLN